MKTKLTLSIDGKILNKAKQAAKMEKKSLSELVEGYFKKKYVLSKSNTPITDSLTGILKGKMPDLSTKELRDLQMKDKYGI